MTDPVEAAVRSLVDAIRAELRAELDAERGPGPDRLLSVGEAATALGCGRSLTYQEIAAGRIRSVKVGRRRLVPSSAVLEYIAGRSA